MDALYDIYLTGKLADGLSPAQAAARLAQLFKSKPDTMTRLLSGKPQLLKRGVDRATALKYREALSRAGVAVAFKAQAQTAAPSAKPAWSIAPVGAEVLTAQERHAAPIMEIDTSGLSIAPAGAALGTSQPLPPPTAPNVGHLSLAARGGELLSPEQRAGEPAHIPKAGDWSLAAAGTPLETLSEIKTPWQSAGAREMTLAPVGSELLSGTERQKPVASAPRTDHLRVVETPG